MASYFTAEQIDELKNAAGKVFAKASELKEQYVRHTFRDPKAREHAVTGFARRIDSLAHCIEVVFGALPPDLEGIPERTALVEASVNIQAFVINAAGCCDNLAWTWALEIGATQPDGVPLLQRQIGLTSECQHLWRTIPEPLRRLLTERRPWFKHIKGFRDSLAHRIPLYIPPYTVSPDNIDEYNRLEKENWDALIAGDVALHESLLQQQEKIKRFLPFIVHSYDDNSPNAVFHAQLLADFHTVEELGQLFLAEFDALSGS
ncbi:hypothetical protein ACCS51_28755 [Rhizobium ruizarguesonis]